MKTALLILVNALIIALLFYYCTRHFNSPDEIIRIDTVYVELPQRTVHLPIPPPQESRLPEEVDFFIDTIQQTRIDTVLAECKADSLRIREYQTEFSDSLIIGTFYSSVFGILLDQRLEYQLTIPHIKETVRHTPVRGLVGIEVNARHLTSPSFSLLAGVRFPQHQIILRGDALRQEIGLGYLRTF